MNLSISNISWTNENDFFMYNYLMEQDFLGIEIAPTRIFIDNPYNDLEKAKDFSKNLRENYGLIVSSMQSIWYGRNEKLFKTNEERQVLANYTKKAIQFANAVGCKNIVFGCPKNRVINNENDIDIAISFFKELGEYAELNNTVLSMEPNPEIYNTNFINYTSEAFDIVKKVKSNGFKVNIDLGTIIENKEDLQIISDNIDLVNHIHISEPNLGLIQKRKIHNQLANVLKQVDYEGFISIEMGKCDNLQELKDTIKYIKGVFI